LNVVFANNVALQTTFRIFY